MELELLSPEILLDIITRLPGLDTLNNLLRASPRSWRLFNHEALTITEAVLSRADSLLPPQIQELIRAVILARSSALPFRTFDDFQLKFLRRNLPQFKVTSPPPFMTLGPNSLALVPPSPAVLRSVVATAQHISVLTHACLNSYLSRVREPSFATQHCHEKGFRYTFGYGPKQKCVPPWEREFVGTPVEMRDTGPPSWVEEMRVMRALWLIQLAGDVRRLATKDDSVLGWPREDVKRVSSIEPEELAQITNPGWQPYHGGVEEVRSVTEYLGELEEQRTVHASTKEGPYYRLPRLPGDAAGAAWTTQEPKACLMTWGGVGYTYDYGNGVVWIEPTPEIRELHQHPQASEGQNWGQTRNALESEAPGMSFFMDLTIADNSPLFGIKFDPFRRLGFGIWDKERMHFLGLLDGAHPPYHRPEFYFFAWKSLLSAEEIASVKAAARERHREWRRIGREADFNE
jgi:hypothetical protein